MEVTEETQRGESQTGAQDSIESARRDLANRYQSMVNTQFTALANFEDKAWRTVRATVAVIGVYLTGLSLLAQFGGRGMGVDIFDILPALVGSVSLLGSLYFSILVLASTKVGFGPSKKLGGKMNEQRLSAGDYNGLLLRNYSSAIQANWVAIGEKSTHLGRSLACLLFGLVQVTLGLLFIIAPNPFPVRGEYVKASIFVLVLFPLTYITLGIWKKNSTVNEPEDDGEIDEDGSDRDTA